MPYRPLVVVILAAHWAFLGYLVLGGFLAWRWPRAVWPHVAAVAWGVYVVLVPTSCPLTVAEDWARRHAGEGAVTSGFIDRYVEGVLYPPQYTWLVRVLVALIVLASWTGAWLLYRRHARAAKSRLRRHAPLP
ncbi:MAG TPA: DUF2784 domain-containing protein [Micromonosporaceae bacterium]